MSVGRTHISRTRGGQKTVGRPPFLRTVRNQGRDSVKVRGAGRDARSHSVRAARGAAAGVRHRSK